MGYATENRATAVAPESNWTAKFPFYYGWVQVVLASIAMSATLPGRTYGLGLIKEPIRFDLNISDLGFSWMNFGAIIIGSIFVLPVGTLIDRVGSRLVLAGVVLLLGGSVLLMSRSTNATELFITLTLVRGLAQGALSVVAIALVGKWFRKRAGMAMGVFTLLLSIGFLAPYMLLGEAVKSQGWRPAWDGIAYALLFGLLPLGVIFSRNTPETCGVQPDDPVTDVGPLVTMNVWATLRTPAFWVYSATATVFNLTFSALTLDNEQLLNDHGLNGSQAKDVIMVVLMLSGLPANIIAGSLARRRPMGKLLAVGVAILAVSLLYFPSISTLIGAAAYAILLGASGGAITVIYFAVYGHTYGRLHLGSIQAVVQAFSVLASAIGPVVLSGVREWYGKTDVFFFAFAAITVVLAIAAWFVPVPNRAVAIPPVDEAGVL